MTTTDTATLCGREQQTQCVQNTGPYFSVTVQQTRSRCATQPHDYNRHGHAVWKRTANTMCTKHWPLRLCHCPVAASKFPLIVGHQVLLAENKQHHQSALGNS